MLFWANVIVWANKKQKSMVFILFGNLILINVLRFQHRMGKQQWKRQKDEQEYLVTSLILVRLIQLLNNVLLLD